MQPTTKSKEVEDFISSVAGKSREESVKNDECAWCGDPVTPYAFRDRRSLDEYKISGMCQKCQDEAFGD